MYKHFSIIGIFLIIYVLIKVKNRIFSESKSIFWICGGIFMVIFPFYPLFLVKIAAYLKIDYPPALLFLLGIIFLFFLVFRQEKELTLLNERMKEIAQRNAILESKLNKTRK